MSLQSPYVFEYTYRRSTGPVIGRFLTGLREARVEGIRNSEGQVIVPPTEYDPRTGEALSDWVELGQTGTVQTWSWVAEPRETHPLSTPFAFGLVLLDGADTAMLHAIDAPREAMKTGMRVRVRWAEQRKGSILDIACFELPDPEGGTGGGEAPPGRGSERSERCGGGTPSQQTRTDAVTVDAGPEQAPITRIKTPVHLDFTVSVGGRLERFLTRLMDGVITGARCPETGKVIVPPRVVNPATGRPLEEEEIELPDTGTVTTFCVINIPFEGQVLEPPYVAAAIILDGADLPIFHIIGGIDPSEVRMGLRVKARWRPDPKPTLATIEYFEPTGEPDTPFERYAEHL